MRAKSENKGNQVGRAVRGPDTAPGPFRVCGPHSADSGGCRTLNSFAGKLLFLLRTIISYRTMSLSSQQTLPDRVCFVTIGATAGFDALIKATLSAPFLEALQELDYTELRLQYGKDGHSILLEHQERIFNQNEPGDLKISGFDFKKRGLHSELKAAIGESDGVKGVVISHAGNRPDISPSASIRLHSHRLWLHSRCSSYWSSSNSRP